MDTNERIFYNANTSQYGFLRKAEKEANDELLRIKAILGEDSLILDHFLSKYNVLDSISRKALGLSYDHYYEHVVNDKIDQIYEFAKERAIDYIENGKQEDYDKSKKLLSEYYRLNEYRLIEVDNVWDPWDDKIYTVTFDEYGERHFKEFDPMELISEAK